jgi:hypothetical protein
LQNIADDEGKDNDMAEDEVEEINIINIKNNEMEEKKYKKILRKMKI